MAITLSRKTAQKIVDTIKDVCGHDINYINTNGIIFASTNPSRIGDFHEIGKKVIESAETIEIKKLLPQSELAANLMKSASLLSLPKKSLHLFCASRKSIL